MCHFELKVPQKLISIFFLISQSAEVRCSPTWLSRKCIIILFTGERSQINDIYTCMSISVKCARTDYILSSHLLRFLTGAQPLRFLVSAQTACLAFTMAVRPYAVFLNDPSHFPLQRMENKASWYGFMASNNSALKTKTKEGVGTT